MQLKHVNPFSLKKNEWNSNKVDRPSFEKLKQSLTKHNAFKPVKVRELEDGTYEILGGFHRNEAAKELGWETIPIINLGTVPDDQAKEIGLIDNTRYGEDDKELLEKLLSEMDTESLEAVLPDRDLLEIPSEDTDLEEMLEAGSKEYDEKDLPYRYIRIKLENDKADEVEDAILKVAADDGYTGLDYEGNLGEALYHILFLKGR